MEQEKEQEQEQEQGYHLTSSLQLWFESLMRPSQVSRDPAPYLFSIICESRRAVQDDIPLLSAADFLPPPLLLAQTRPGYLCSASIYSSYSPDLFLGISTNPALGLALMVTVIYHHTIVKKTSDLFLILEREGRGGGVP